MNPCRRVHGEPIKLDTANADPHVHRQCPASIFKTVLGENPGYWSQVTWVIGLRFPPKYMWSQLVPVLPNIYSQSQNKVAV